MSIENPNENIDQQPLSMIDGHAAAALSQVAVPSSHIPEVDIEAALSDEFAAQGLTATEEQPVTTQVNAVEVVVMVNLDMTSRAIYSNAPEFSLIDSAKGPVNVYSPFLKEIPGKSGLGIARTTFLETLANATRLNNGNLYLLGDDFQVEANLTGLLEKLLVDARKALPFAPSDPVCDVTLVDADAAETSMVIRMKDIVRVTGWINYGDEDSTFKVNTLVVNFTIAAGAFYDEAEPHAYVNTVRTFMSNAKKRSESKTKVVLGITMLPEELFMVESGDLQNALFTEDEKWNYTPCGRSQLLGNGTGFAWAPQTKTQVEKDLLTVGGDIFIVKEF